MEFSDHTGSLFSLVTTVWQALTEKYLSGLGVSWSRFAVVEAGKQESRQPIRRTNAVGPLATRAKTYHHTRNIEED
jgi:hypothetical protein